MVVVMKERATEAQIDTVIARLIELGMDVHRSSGATRTVLGVVGAHKIDPELIGILEGVHEVLRITEPYKRASRSFKPDNTVVTLDDVRIGGDEVIVMNAVSRLRSMYSRDGRHAISPPNSNWSVTAGIQAQLKTQESKLK